MDDVATALKPHAALVERAARWLRNSCVVACDRYPIRLDRFSCGVVLTECPGGNGEIPDAIGFAYGARISVMIECKVSRSDFFADINKKFHRTGNRAKYGLGRYRYFMSPQGVLRFDDMPERFGLLEVIGRRVVVTRLALPMESCHIKERNVLWSALREIQN